MRHTRVGMFGKAVGDMFVKPFGNISSAIERETGIFAVWTQVVSTANVVVVDVCDECGIQVCSLIITEHLNVEIRTAVYNDIFAVILNESGSTQAFVFWVCGSANAA